MKIKLAVFAVLLASLLFLSNCNIFEDLFLDPWDHVYFENGELMVPACGSYFL